MNGTRILENDREKASLLNSYYSQCFNQSVPPLKFNDDDIIVFDLNLLQCPEELLFSEEEVFEMLLSLDTKKANTWDGISARMLKSTVPSISPRILHCYSTNLFLQGKFLKRGRYIS